MTAALVAVAASAPAIDDNQIAAVARGVLYAHPETGADLRAAAWDGRRVDLDFTAQVIGPDGRLSAAGELAVAAVQHAVSNLLLTEGIVDCEFFTRVGGEPLEKFLEPRPSAPARSPLAAPGRKIVLGPGHGYYDHHLYGWTLQRGYYFGIVEDFMNVEFMLEADARLRPMGFETVPVRNFDKAAGLGASGFPKWQECAREYLRTLGAPSSVWNSTTSSTPDLQYNQDIRARPLYANHIGAALFISLHNNAGGGTGTETLYDTTNGQQAESQRFADIVNGRIISRIRSQYLASWVNRGVKGFNGNYGENRIAACPSVIIEVGFFDKETPDNAAQHDPVFHQIVGQAIADSVAEFFEQPVLTYTAHQIDDDVAEESSGNGDGEIDAGETVEVKLTLRNTGFGTATTVTGRVAVDDPFVTVSDPDTTWSNISPNFSGISLGDFGFAISPNCPPNHSFTANFTFEGGQGIWTRALPLTVVGSSPADLVDAGAAYHGLSAALAEPGQNLTVSGRINNTGPSPSGLFKVRFYASVDAVVTAADTAIGDLNAGSFAGLSSMTFHTIVPLPPQLVPGRFYIGWIIDAEASVAEANEGNNSVVIATPRLTVATPGSAVAIASISAAVSGTELQFTTKPGFTYAVERSEDLAAWSRIFSAIPGTGAVLTRAEPGVQPRSRVFYRIIEE